jgi:inosine-uridine nucleoside N-ribohydrolase
MTDLDCLPNDKGFRTAESMRCKLILDVDTGTDDAVAIMLAALHPDLELLACTTVNGNVDVVQATDNTLRTLDLVDAKDVPVFRGLERPLVRSDFPIPRSVRDLTSYIHGYELPMPRSNRVAERPHAVEFLIDIYRRATEEITLVALGPLSNIAAMAALAPDVVGKVSELVIMGGAHSIGGLTPSSGFNTWADPEAAASVLSAGFRKVTMILIDATHQALVTRKDCAALAALDTPAGRGTAKLVERRIAGHDEGQPMEVPDSAPVHDPICVAYLVDPDIISTRFLHVGVETKGELTLGRTVIDVSGRGKLPKNCHAAFYADRRKFIELLTKTFGQANRHR